VSVMIDKKSEFFPFCLLCNLSCTVEVPSDNGTHGTSVVSDFDWSGSFVSSGDGRLCAQSS